MHSADNRNEPNGNDSRSQNEKSDRNASISVKRGVNLKSFQPVLGFMLLCSDS